MSRGFLLKWSLLSRLESSSTTCTSHFFLLQICNWETFTYQNEDIFQVRRESLGGPTSHEHFTWHCPDVLDLATQTEGVSMIELTVYEVRFSIYTLLQTPTFEDGAQIAHTVAGLQTEWRWNHRHHVHTYRKHHKTCLCWNSFEGMALKSWMTLFGHGQVMSVTNPVVAWAQSMDHRDPFFQEQFSTMAGVWQQRFRFMAFQVWSSWWCREPLVWKLRLWRAKRGRIFISQPFSVRAQALDGFKHQRSFATCHLIVKNTVICMWHNFFRWVGPTTCKKTCDQLRSQEPMSLMGYLTSSTAPVLRGSLTDRKCSVCLRAHIPW